MKFTACVAFILFIVFLVLKLVGVIAWSMWWVTSPLWIFVGLIVLVVGLAVVFREKIADFLVKKVQKFVDALTGTPR